MPDQQAQELTPAERDLVRIAQEAGEPPTLRALRQARADLGCCVTAFEKIEIGTEQAPMHLRRHDAERALARVDAALRLAARSSEQVERPDEPYGQRVAKAAEAAAKADWERWVAAQNAHCPEKPTDRWDELDSMSREEAIAETAQILSDYRDALGAPIAARLPERPDEGPKRYLVWLCDGCDECDPPAGLPRSQFPCDGPSKSGKCVVLAKDYDRAVASRQPADSDRVLAEEEITDAMVEAAAKALEYGEDVADDLDAGYWRYKAREVLKAAAEVAPVLPTEPAGRAAEVARLSGILVAISNEWDRHDKSTRWAWDQFRRREKRAIVDAILTAAFAARPPVSENEKGPRPA